MLVGKARCGMYPAPLRTFLWSSIPPARSVLWGYARIFSLLFSRSPILQQIRRRIRNQAEEKCGQTPRDLNCWKVEVNSSVLEVNNFKQISANVQDDGPKHIHHGERSRLQLLLAAVAARTKPALTRGPEQMDTPMVIASKSTPKAMIVRRNSATKKSTRRT